MMVDSLRSRNRSDAYPTRSSEEKSVDVPLSFMLISKSTKLPWTWGVLTALPLQLSPPLTQRRNNEDELPLPLHLLARLLTDLRL